MALSLIFMEQLSIAARIQLCSLQCTAHNDDGAQTHHCHNYGQVEHDNVTCTCTQCTCSLSEMTQTPAARGHTTQNLWADMLLPQTCAAWQHVIPAVRMAELQPQTLAAYPPALHACKSTSELHIIINT
jgi:hypothetical protein